MYFVVRSLIMTIISSALTLIVFWHYRSIDLSQDIALGVFTFISSLVLSRLVDVRIIEVSKEIARYLGEHDRLREFVLNNF